MTGVLIQLIDIKKQRYSYIHQSLIDFIGKLLRKMIVLVIYRFREVHIFPLVDVEVLKLVFTFAHPDFVYFVVFQALVHSAWRDAYKLRAACNCIRSSIIL